LRRSLWRFDEAADHILLRNGGGRTSVPGLRRGLGSVLSSFRPTSIKATKNIIKLKKMYLKKSS
jgi:hypothetical protein